MKSIDSGSTVKLQYALPSQKTGIELFPNGVSPQFADESLAKVMLVCFSRSIPIALRELSFGR